MKTLLATLVLSTLATSVSFAQPAPVEPTEYAVPTTPPVVQPPGVSAQPGVQPVSAPAVTPTDEDDSGWHTPVGKRFTSGFRLGYMYLSHYDKVTRDNNMSLKDELGLKSPSMFLVGYEAFYRIVGHSWLNVLMVGNVTVVGLEQSKFIPAASGLIGFELDRNFQLGVGVNVTPDQQAPSHMIAAVGWTPKVGSIQTPIHFFFVPDASGNSRTGATIGMNW